MIGADRMSYTSHENMNRMERVA